MATKTIRKALISSIATSASDVSNISVVTATVPAPGRKQVQIRVLYSGFGGADVAMARGSIPLARKPPLTPGYCLTGVITALGPGQSSPPRFQPGDYVTAVTTYDGQAELVNVADKLLVPVPAELRSDAMLQQTTGLALDWSTAHGMVANSARVQAGQRVFVHGLSGAVGQGLLALCLLRGADVYGTASARNHAALQAAGAKGVFEYRTKDWIAAMKEVGGADAVFDPLGFESWDESYSILSPGGILVGYGGNQGALSGDEKNLAKSPLPYIGKLAIRGLLPFTGKRTSFYIIKPGSAECQDGLASLVDSLKEKKISVPIKAVWDLTTEGLREAHQSWGKMPGMGTLLIRVGAEKE